MSMSLVAFVLSCRFYTCSLDQKLYQHIEHSIGGIWCNTFCSAFLAISDQLSPNSIYKCVMFRVAQRSFCHLKVRIGHKCTQLYLCSWTWKLAQSWPHCLMPVRPSHVRHSLQLCADAPAATLLTFSAALGGCPQWAARPLQGALAPAMYK